MSKIFTEAIDKYYMSECEMGCPRYIVFNFLNTQKDHKKIFLKIELAPKVVENQPNATSLAIKESLKADIVIPEDIKYLLKQ